MVLGNVHQSSWASDLIPSGTSLTVSELSTENIGSIYFSYHGTFSIVLMAIGDADYRIRYADVGCQGRISDGGVFKGTSFYYEMENNKLNIPKPKPLPALPQGPNFPFVLVSDDAFALSMNIMKPLPGTCPTGSPERAYNYRLSRARRIIENVFGLLAAVFRVFRKPIPLQPKKTNCSSSLYTSS
jgi:hypothetical protein